MGYPTPKQQKLIWAIERMYLLPGKPLAPTYAEYCKEKGLDLSTYRAVKSYLDKYKEDFLKEQENRRFDVHVHGGVSGVDDPDYDEDMAFMEPEY